MASVSSDPRLASTRRWSNTKLTITIAAIIAVMFVASSVFWLPVLVGPDETPVHAEATEAAPANP